MVEKKTATTKEKTAKKTVKTEKVEKAVKADKKAITADKFVAKMGKRKRASASVRMTKGTGIITVNGQDFNEYFDTSYQKKAVEQPIKQAGLKDLDYSIIVRGGGKTGQAEAIRLGITKTLIELNPELRPSLKAKGWIKRDPRVKERKKPGLKRARRAPQWSKR
jgi:small subunit ribosomal protein S9